MWKLGLRNFKQKKFADKMIQRKIFCLFLCRCIFELKIEGRKKMQEEKTKV